MSVPCEGDEQEQRRKANSSHWMGCHRNLTLRRYRTLLIFCVTGGTSALAGKGFTPKLAYAVAAIAYAIIFLLLRPFSAGLLAASQNYTPEYIKKWDVLSGTVWPLPVLVFLVLLYPYLRKKAADRRAANV
jgi:hypothetical protein